VKIATQVALTAIALSAANLAFGQPAPPPPPARGPAMALALEAAQTALQTCAANGYKVTALVVDSSGAERVLLAADGAPAVTHGFGLRKAVTAITFKKPSGAVGEDAKTDKALADRIAADPKLITWAGAQPLVVGGDVIGALGVSGAPGGDKDDACTSAGIAKIKDRLK
jgi:uncharacterized protein GlcG (DUF336 family)